VPTLLGSPRGGDSGTGGAGWGPGCATAPPTPTPSVSFELPPHAPLPTPLPSSGTAPTSKPVPTEPPRATMPTPQPADRPVPTPVEPCPPSGEPSPTPMPAPTSIRPPVSFAWPPPNVVPAHYTAEQLTQRGAEMRAYLRTRFATVVPGATEVQPGVFGGEAVGSVSNGQRYLNAFTGFTLNGTRSAVDIWVSAPGATEVPLPAEECAHGTNPVCKAAQRPDGSWVVTKTEQISKEGMAILSVTHYRTSGAVVRATGYNYDPLSPSAPTVIPVSAMQLTELAIDPALNL
jgi:hypothetical protein